MSLNLNDLKVLLDLKEMNERLNNLYEINKNENNYKINGQFV